jgi:quercetin 2,3-dioxygenase
VINGDVTVDTTELKTGDGAGVTGVESLNLKWSKGSEFILFDFLF